VAIGPGLFKIPLPPLHAPRASLGWLDRNGYENWSAAQVQSSILNEHCLNRWTMPRSQANWSPSSVSTGRAPRQKNLPNC
jgi:hypothetical protein